MVDTYQGASTYPRGALSVHNGAAWAAHNPAGDRWLQVVGVQETTTQLSAMLASQSLLTGLDLDAASGVYSTLYRSGDDRLKAEVEDLLRSGTTAGRRYLASVDLARKASIYRAPLPGSADYGITSAGELTDPAGQPVPPWRGVVGVWARLRDLIPTSADTTRLANASRFFIEGAKWSPPGLRLTTRPEG
jgi:hypothetical protein